MTTVRVGKNYRTVYDLVCDQCGRGFTARQGTVYCSRTCMGQARRKPSTPRRQVYISELMDVGEWGQVVDRLLDRTTRVGECMDWTGKMKDGYALVRVRGKDVQVHRLMLQAKHEGRPLGVIHAHHVCGRASCVNPDHLQPATAAENVGEMKARQSYLARIRELEEAIREVDPDHPVLHRVPMNGVSWGPDAKPQEWGTRPIPGP